MFAPTPLTVLPQHLSQLSQDRAVDAFRELLWAEGHRLGIGINLISVPTRINVSDGGIDAEVDHPTSAVGHGIIRPGLNSYQVKTGDFNPRHLDSTKKLLFTPKSINSRGELELQPRVKACLDRGGRFVVVLFGWDNPDVGEHAATTLRSEICAFDSRYADADIEVWRLNQLIGWFQLFPSLAFRLNGLAGEPFQTHAEWSSSSEMRRLFHAGAEQDAQIREIQRSLREVVGPVHIRVSGEPGIGKTRLVLEATRSDDLQSSLLYFEHPDQLLSSQLFRELTREASSLSAILVVDECSRQDSARIWNRLEHASPRVKLVTIDVAEAEAGTDVRHMRVLPLPAEEVTRIIQGYIPQQYEAERWAAMCDGSPRVAHVVGENLQRHPGDIFREPSTAVVWDRFVAAEGNPNSPEVRERRLVLQHLALFRRFGFEGEVALEGRAICALIEQVAPSITQARFREIVQDLRQQKRLQGERTLYITPPLFHIWLWVGWWETYGSDAEFDRLLGQLPASLMQWFLDMFAYAADSDTAARTVRRLLSQSGPFEGQALLEGGNRPRFLRILALADPGAALRLLQRTVGAWSDDDLKNLSTGRQELVWTLEGIAMWQDYFSEAAQLLLRLAETEEGEST